MEEGLVVNALSWALGGLALIPNSLQACCSTANMLLELSVPQFSSFPPSPTSF